MVDTKKLGTIAYMIVMVFYGVYSMILSIQAYSKFSNISQNYLNMANNYKESFIIDIQTSLSSCSAGYTSLFLWNWGGTSAGCDCSTSSYASSYKDMHAHTCNSTEISKGCSTVSSIGAQKFEFAKGASYTPMSVCVKRSTTPFYKLAKSQTGVCSSSQKTCGNTANKETIICVGATEDCPYYDFKYSASQDLTTYPTISWKETTLSQGFLYASKGPTATKLPNSELRFTQSGVCKYDNTAKVLPSGSSDYMLLESTRYSCSSLDATFSVYGFTLTESDYYKMNLSTANYNKLSAMYGFTFSSSNYQSYQRSFISWKTSARDKLYDFVDSADSINNLKSAQLVVMIVTILVCIMVSVILQVSQVYNLMGKDVPCIEGEGEAEKKRIIRIKKILTYGSKALQLPFLLWAFIVSAQKKGMLRYVADLSPSDASFNAEISSFATLLEDNVFKKNLIAIIILGLTILLDIVMLCKEKYCSKKKTDASVKPVLHDENSVLKPMQQNIQMVNPTPSGFEQPPMQQGVFIQQQPGVIVQQPGVFVQQPQMFVQQPGMMVQQPGMYMQPQVVVVAGQNQGYQVYQ